MNEKVKQGPIEGVNRILREVLRSPRFKGSIRLLLQDLDPENAALVVKTIAHEEPELFMSLLFASGDFANIGVHGTKALVESLDFPPALFDAFLVQLIGKIDAESLGEAAGSLCGIFLSMAERKNPELRSAGSKMAENFQKGFTAALETKGVSVNDLSDKFAEILTDRIAKFVEKTGRESTDRDSSTLNKVEQIQSALKGNPAFVKNVLAPILNTVSELSEENSDEG